MLAVIEFVATPHLTARSSDHVPAALLRRAAASFNQALQRTAPAVTAPASGRRLSSTTQGSRQPPWSLILGALGVARAV